MKRSVVAAAVVLVVAGVAVAWGVQRDREWAHGGDGLTVTVDVEAATPATLDATAARLGVPSGEASVLRSAEQPVVVRVGWSGSARTDGSYQLIALDGRVTPPRLLVADGGWNSAGGTGSNWSSAYEELAVQYDWLSRIAETGDADTGAIDAPAAAAGTVTAFFRPADPSGIPFQDVKREVVVALFYVGDDGEVRWARRVSG